MDSLGAEGLWDLIPPQWRPWVGLLGLLVMIASNLSSMVKNQGALIPRLLHFLAMNWDKAFPRRPQPQLAPAPPPAEQVAGPAAKLQSVDSGKVPFAGG